MRRLLEAVALAALAVQAWITGRALWGPERLPGRIPLHFNAAGTADAWGSPATLLTTPAVALGIYLLFTVVTRYPSAFNYPVRVTVENRAHLQGLALGMIAWLKVEVLCLFAGMQWATIEAAREPQRGLSPTLMPVALVAVFATIGWHIAAMFRTGSRAVKQP